MEDSWPYWINEPIYISENGIAYGKRKNVIAEMCVKGLIPFVKQGGYCFRYSETELVKQILVLLFTLHRGKQVCPKVLQIDIPYEQEQYYRFHHNLDTMDWLQFWETWGGIQDFEEGSFAYKFRFQLPEFVWSWLQFDRSPAVMKLEKEIEEDDYLDELSKGKDDPYLQDTLKRDYQDRHWH